MKTIRSYGVIVIFTVATELHDFLFLLCLIFKNTKKTDFSSTFSFSPRRLFWSENSANSVLFSRQLNPYLEKKGNIENSN